MDVEQFKTTIEFLYEQKQKRDAWIDKLPSDISSAFFDNEHVDSLHNEISFLLKMLFKPELLEEIEYFLYEWYPHHDEFKTITTQSGKTYTINSLDDFVSYVEQEYSLSK